MPSRVNCQHATNNGCCSHHAAPRKFFGLPNCIVMFPPTDARLLTGCKLAYPYQKPDGHPLPPPGRVVVEGRFQQFTDVPATREPRP